MTKSELDSYDASKILDTYRFIKEGQSVKKIKELLGEYLQSKDSYNPKKDYIFLFEDNNGPYSCYSEFKRSLEKFIAEVYPFIQSMHIEKEFQEIINAYNQYSFDLEQLTMLSKTSKKTLQEHSGIKGWMNIKENSQIKKEFFYKLYDLSQQIQIIDAKINSFKDNHTSNVKTYFTAMRERHPELYLSENIGDYNLLKQMEAEGLFETKEYYLLKNQLLKYLVKEKFYRSDNLEIIYRLLHKLRIGNNSRTFFLNLKRYQRHFWISEYPAALASVISSYSMNIAIFFDNVLFEIIDSIDMILVKGQKNWTRRITDVFSARSNVNILFDDYTIRLMRLKLYSVGVYKLRETLFEDDNTLISHPTDRASEIRDSMQILASSKLKLDLRKSSSESINILGKLLTVLNKSFARFLVKTDIRCIYSMDDVYNIENISKICQAANINYFAHDQKIWFYWSHCIYNNLREFFYLDIFLQCYISPKYGKKFFDELLSKNIKLSSTNLIDIFDDISSGSKISEETQSRILNAVHIQDNRKMIVCTLPGSDHNNAFDDTLKQILTLPKDKYEIHVIRIKSSRQLAHMLKDIAAIRKIDILLINGHGATDRTHLSDNRLGEEHLTKESLNDTTFEGIKACFNNEAVCYLISCSTGKGEEPLAKYVSKAFGIKVYAPKDESQSIIGVANGELSVNLLVEGEDGKVAFIPNKTK
jgi:hypothetical protein